VRELTEGRRSILKNQASWMGQHPQVQQRHPWATRLGRTGQHGYFRREKLTTYTALRKALLVRKNVKLSCILGFTQADGSASMIEILKILAPYLGGGLAGAFLAKWLRRKRSLVQRIPLIERVNRLVNPELQRFALARVVTDSAGRRLEESRICVSIS
jgi:hypothetical protein